MGGIIFQSQIWKRGKNHLKSFGNILELIHRLGKRSFGGVPPYMPVASNFRAESGVLGELSTYPQALRLPLLNLYF